MNLNERKLSSASLIPLEIDPASILSLSKGVIFDTIVHNIEQNLSNETTNPLPWRLTGMSLVCDANRNKKFLQKLQKMQCVRSEILTDIYHSKLILTPTGSMSTVGRKLIIPTIPRRRLTGIIIAKSIDDLLHLEPETSKQVHFIQYKLLSFGRIPTREIINGPRLSMKTDKFLKTVFDFDLTQNNGFPRQLLPLAIISFTRHETSDLCLSIRNFLSLPEHKNFDRSFLICSTSDELRRMREEKQRREEEEAENDPIWEKLTERRPLGEISRKENELSDFSFPATPPRVPPLKIKLPREVFCTEPVDARFQCSVRLERIDLSAFGIEMPKKVVKKLKTIKKKKKFVTREPLPAEFNCSVVLTRIEVPQEETATAMEICETSLLNIVESPGTSLIEEENEAKASCMMIVQCSDDEDYGDDEQMEKSAISASPTSFVEEQNYFVDQEKTMLHRSSCSSSCSSLSTKILLCQSPKSEIRLVEVFLPEKVRRKFDAGKCRAKLNLNRTNVDIPHSAQQSLVDPRLIYRLRLITSDLEWRKTCFQCSTNCSVALNNSDRQTTIDPRRQSLKNVLLELVFQRLKHLASEENLDELKNVIFQQTQFSTNCSVHLESLIAKIRTAEESTFLEFIKSNEEFQLSFNLLNLIFNRSQKFNI